MEKFLRSGCNCDIIYFEAYKTKTEKRDTMKQLLKLAAATLIILLLVPVFCLPGAAVYVADWSGVKLEEFIRILNSYVETSDTLLIEGNHTMRGFAVSPDGKYAFGGFLNPGGTSAVNMFDLDTAVPIGAYAYEQADGKRSYAKGLAVDDRGYLYVGLAYNPNYGAVDFAVVSYNDKGEMTEVSYTNIITEGTRGSSSSPKLGVNGVAVEKLGEKYYAYFVINYDLDYLYRFDVTDPAKPTLDTSFGTGGRVDLAAKYSVPSGKDAQYLDVASDGTIYLCATTTTDCLLIISADGNTLIDSINIPKAYSVCLTDEYIYVTSSSGPSAVNVLDRITLQQVATISGHTGANNYVYVIEVDGVLYVANQGSDTVFDSILVAPLTDAAKALIESRRATIAAALESANTTTPGGPDETTTSPDTEPPATEPSGESTTAPVDNESTTAPAGSDGTTKASEPGKKGGCKSSVAAGLLLPAILIPAVIIRKKKD